MAELKSGNNYSSAPIQSALRNLDWDQTLEHLAGFATGSFARDRLRNTSCLASATAAETQFKEIDEARQILSGGLRPFMESVDVYALWAERLKRQAVLKTNELRDTRGFCHEVIALKELIQEYRSPWARSRFEALMDATRPLSAIDRIMTSDGEIRTDASENLYRLYKEKLEIERKIRTTMEKLVRSNDMDNILQDKFVANREGRWVIPVKSGRQHEIDGIIHDASQTKQTVFIEPEVTIQLNNQLRTLNTHIEEEIERLLEQLSHFLHNLMGEFEVSRNVLLECDERFAQAQLALMLNAEAPIFDETRIHLKDLRHPVLVLQKGEESVISNTVDLHEDRRILLLSGPNAGGKTVLMKAVGLASQMARCGLLISAGHGSRLPFFKQMVVGLGDSQSVDEQLSTFAAHLKTLTEASRAHGPQTLVLVDEICGSTDPEEGSALARSFIEHFSKQGLFGVITSHFGPLKENWPRESGVITGSMDFRDDENRATYMLIIGVYGRSMALSTAKRVGVPADIINRALELVSPEARAREVHLSDIESAKQEVMQLRTNLQNELQQATGAKRRYHDLLEKFRTERDEWIRKSTQQAEAKLEKIVNEVRQTLLLKKEVTTPKAQEEFRARLPEIIKLSSRKTVEEDETITTADDFARRFPAGSPVFIANLNQDGIVQSAPNLKGEVIVQSQSMRLTLSWTQLAPPRKPTNPTVQLTRRSGVVSSQLHTEDRALDLRGMSVEDALAKLELTLDRAVQNQEHRMKIVHGHGTEALKRAIRQYLSRSVYVQKWQAGKENGDGTTIIDL